jgi:hypothetical protein
MPRKIEAPTRIEAAGNKPKLIDEYFGRVNNGHAALSVAHMRSPGGWVEPGQRPSSTSAVVLRGLLRVEHEQGALEVRVPGRRRRPARGALQHPSRKVRSTSRSASRFLAVDRPPRFLKMTERVPFAGTARRSP